LKAKPFYLFITLFCLVGWLWLLISTHTDEQGSEFTVCPIKTVTGYPCPSCGTTRSVSAFFVGDWHTALHTNPLGLLASALLVVIPLWLLLDACLQRPTLHRAFRRFETIFTRPYVYIPFFILILLNWIWNISKGL
jgi:hypothetical protein